MRNMIKRKYFKAISLMLIAAFLNLEMAWAYTALRENRGTLAVQSIFQPEMMTLEASMFRGSILEDASLLMSVFAIGDYLLGSSFRSGAFSPSENLEYLETVIRSELPPDVYRGIELENVVTTGYLRRNRREEFEKAQEYSGVQYPSTAEVVIIPYTDNRDGSRYLIQLAERRALSQDDLAGYDLPAISGKYAVKVISKEHKKGDDVRSSADAVSVPGKKARTPARGHVPEAVSEEAPGGDSVSRDISTKKAPRGAGARFGKLFTGITLVIASLFISVATPKAVGAGVATQAVVQTSVDAAPDARPKDASSDEKFEQYAREFKRAVWFYCTKTLHDVRECNHEGVHMTVNRLGGFSRQWTSFFNYIFPTDDPSGAWERVKDLNSWLDIRYHGPARWRENLSEYMLIDHRGVQRSPGISLGLFILKVYEPEIYERYRNSPHIRIMDRRTGEKDYREREPHWFSSIFFPEDARVARRWHCGYMPLFLWGSPVVEVDRIFVAEKIENAVGIAADLVHKSKYVFDTPPTFWDWYRREMSMFGEGVVSDGVPFEEEAAIKARSDFLKKLLNVRPASGEHFSFWTGYAHWGQQFAARRARAREVFYLVNIAAFASALFFLFFTPTLITVLKLRKRRLMREFREKLEEIPREMIEAAGIFSGNVLDALVSDKETDRDRDRGRRRFSNAFLLGHGNNSERALDNLILSRLNESKIIRRKIIPYGGDIMMIASRRILRLKRRLIKQIKKEEKRIHLSKKWMPDVMFKGRMSDLSGVLSKALSALSGGESFPELALKEPDIFPKELDAYLQEFIELAGLRKYVQIPEGVRDADLAEALRAMQLVYFSRNAAKTGRNLVRYAWAGKANRLLYGLDSPGPGEYDVAEVWHGSTVIKDGKEENPSFIKDTAIKVGDVSLPDIRLRELIERVPGVLGGKHREKPFFVKSLSTRFANKVHMGFNSKMKTVSRGEFIGWLVAERKNMEKMRESIKKGITRDEFEEYLKQYERWVTLQADARWGLPSSDSRVAGIIDGMGRYFEPSLDLPVFLDEVSSVRADIVSVLNEIELKPGMTVLSPAGYPHAIFGLSHQTHPVKVRTREDGTAEYPKNEAWIVISVKDDSGEEHIVNIEPQQTSNDTYSWADFYTPVVWNESSGEPVMRKEVTSDDIRTYVEDGLYVDRITEPEDFIQKPAGPSSFGEGKILIYDTSPVWQSRYFMARNIKVKRAGLESKWSKDQEHPGEWSYHELIVTAGRARLIINGVPPILLDTGDHVFIPAWVEEYTVECHAEKGDRHMSADFLQFFPVEESYRDIEGTDRSPSDPPIFELVKSTINNRRARAAKAANELLAYMNRRVESGAVIGLTEIDRQDNTAKMMGEMAQVLELAKNMDLPQDLTEAAGYIKDNMDQIEVDSVIASIIIMARRARRNGTNLTIGLETSWIPGYERGKLQHTAMNPLLRSIEGLEKTLKSMGLDNVKIIVADGDDLAADILREVSPDKLSEVVVMASHNTINSPAFGDLRSSGEKRRAFIAAINPSDLQEYYDTNGELFEKQMAIEFVQMLSIALELASGKEAPDIPILAEYDKDLRIVLFLPQPEKMTYNELDVFYRMKLRALQSA